MNQRFRDFGMDAVPAATRLAAFNRVQDTYLSIFQVLGGIGVVLGAFGLAILVQRNVAERRPELALMRALGFPVAALRRLVLAEHWVLLAAGLACGVVSALVAVLPTFSDSRADPPWAALALVLGGVLLSGIISTRLAIWRALQGDLISGLRRE
jgi:ABC-type antimicrobial peptide transport system permease subunit